MSYACPKCQSSNLTVIVEVRALLIQDAKDPDYFETTISSGAHEWGRTAP